MELILASEIIDEINHLRGPYSRNADVRATLIALARRGILSAVVVVPEGKTLQEGDVAFKVER